MQQRLHGSRPAAETLGDLGFGKILVIAEHDGRALSRGQGAQRIEELMIGGFPLHLGVGTAASESSGLRGCTTKPIEMQAQHRSLQPSPEGFRGAFRVPPAHGAQERLLRQVLGFPASGHQVREANGACVMERVQRFELTGGEWTHVSTGVGVYDARVSASRRAEA
jgi:hypothetical protein